jgi:hypothetical protein
MDSDPEEEAFVTQIAEKLINQHEGGRVNFDDENPDMEAGMMTVVRVIMRMILQILREVLTA